MAGDNNNPQTYQPPPLPTGSGGDVHQSGAVLSAPVFNGGMSMTGAQTVSGALTVQSGATVSGGGVVKGGLTVSGATALNAAGGVVSGGAQVATTGSGATAPGIYMGSSAPTVSAPIGSLYLRTDGSSTVTRAYIATTTSGGWTGITTSG